MFLLAILCFLCQSAAQTNEHTVVKSFDECPSCGVRGTAVGVIFDADIVLTAKLGTPGETAVFDVQDGSLCPGNSFPSKTEISIRDLNQTHDDPEVKSQLWLLCGHNESPLIWHQPEKITEKVWLQIVAAKRFVQKRDCDEKVCKDLVEGLLDRKSPVHFVIVNRLREFCIESPHDVLRYSSLMPHNLLQRHVSEQQLSGPSEGIKGELSGPSEYILCGLLAACGDANDDKLILDRQFDDRMVDSMTSPEVSVALFLASRGERGLDLLEERLVSFAATPKLSKLEANQRRGWVGGVVNGICTARGSDKISVERLRSCVQKLLGREEYLPRVVQAMVVLEDWSQGDVIAKHFQSGVSESVGIRLVDYLHRVTKDQTPGSNFRVSSAERALDSIRKTHPEIITAAKQRFAWQE